MTSSIQSHTEGQLPAKAGPASTGQRLLWIFERRRAQRGALNIPIVCRLRHKLNKRALENAVTTLVARHEALRTRMQWEPPRLMRVVAPSWRPELRMIDISSAADPATTLEQELGTELTTDILSTEWPIRATVWTLASDNHVVCINLNHLSTDSTSNGIILKELTLLYRAECGDAVASLPEIGWQYSQWVDWQTSQVEGRRTRFIDYWQRQLKDAVGPRFPPAQKPTNSQRLTDYEARPLDADSFDAMAQLARQERATLFCVMLAVFYTAICRQTAQTDLTVTTLLSERNRPQVFSTVGYFINAVPLRTSFSLANSFVDLLHACRATLFGAIQHQTMGFHVLPRTVTRTADIRIDHVVMQMMGETAEFPPPFELWERRPDVSAGRTFDLELVLFPVLGSWWVNMLYGTHQFDRALVCALIDDFCELAKLAVAAPQSTIRDLLSQVAQRRRVPVAAPETAR